MHFSVRALHLIDASNFAITVGISRSGFPWRAASVRLPSDGIKVLYAQLPSAIMY